MLSRQQLDRLLGLIYDHGDPMLFHGADWTDRIANSEVATKVLKKVVKCDNDEHRDCKIALTLIKMIQGLRI